MVPQALGLAGTGAPLGDALVHHRIIVESMASPGSTARRIDDAFVATPCRHCVACIVASSYEYYRREVTIIEMMKLAFRTRTAVMHGP
jgi:hypothetical protein